MVQWEDYMLWYVCNIVGIYVSVVMDIVCVFIDWYVGDCVGIYGCVVGDIVCFWIVSNLEDVIDNIFDG